MMIKKRLFITPQDILDKINHYCFAGKRDFHQGLRVLVAGGGTGNAAIHLAEQLRDYDNCEVFHLDMSQASQDIAKQRASIRKLNNIHWLHESILDIPTLDLGQFDYINCTGVLHHLADPSAGLDALTTVLKDDGAMGLMVYAKYGRTGVYYLQELMQLINQDVSDAADKVVLGQQVIASLPPSHWILRGYNKDKQAEFIHKYLSDPINVYDTFLHTQDRAYAIPELYDWVENSNLFINALTMFDYQQTEKLKYKPETFIQDPSLLTLIHSFPPPKQQAIAELLGGNISLHSFYASKRQQTVAQIDVMDNVPFFLSCHKQGHNIYSAYAGEEVYNFMQANPDEPLICVQPSNVPIRIDPTPYTQYLLRHVDGKKSIAEIVDLALDDINHTDQTINKIQLQEEFFRIYHICNDFDWMLLRDKNLRSHKSYAQMQTPVTRGD